MILNRIDPRVADAVMVLALVVSTCVMILLSGPDRDAGDKTCFRANGEPCAGFVVGPESQELQP